MAFPALRNAKGKVPYYTALVKRARLRVAATLGRLTPTDQAALREAERAVLKETAPPNFNQEDTANAMLERERAFESLCAALEEHGATDAGALPAFRFYARWLVLHERAEAMEAAIRKHH